MRPLPLAATDLYRRAHPTAYWVVDARAIEQPTAIEHVVGLIPLPYPLAAAVWCFVIGSPGHYIVQYLESGTTTFSLSPGALLTQSLYFVGPLYLFLTARYMRVKVLQAEPLITPRLTGVERDYHAAFGWMTRTAPTLPLAAVLALLTMSFGTFDELVPKVTYVGVLDAVGISLAATAFAMVVWEFANASVGLYRLGGSSLRLGPFLEDRMMGTRPFGNLALSLTLVFFGGILLSILLFFAFLPTSLGFQALVASLIVLGVGMFFLPLTSVHAKMRAEKARLHHEVGLGYARVPEAPAAHAGGATLDDVHAALGTLAGIQRLDAMDRRVSSLPTWPFDIQVVSKLVTIVLSVTAVLLSRVITGLLRI